MPGRYERDNDNIELVLRETHETAGRLMTLIESLTAYVNELQSETRPRKEVDP
jgi:hypothetical protein